LLTIEMRKLEFEEIKLLAQGHMQMREPQFKL
jgi:hypothetical protein